MDDPHKAPSWEEKTSLFGAFLVSQGKQSSTLKSYFSAIKFILKTDGYQWDDNAVLLNVLTRSCKLCNDVLKVRLPIKKGLMEMILFQLQRNYPKQIYLELLYKTMIALAYYGLLCIGEITSAPGNEHTIKAANVHISLNKDKIMLVLYSSKMHGKHTRPQKIKISAVSPQKK